jgi:2-methylisocitrate lyase-like PEP mutase family enzyme
MKADQRRRAELFRALHVPGRPVVLFNIWDVGSAMAVAKGGARAIGTSSWSVAKANGFPDGERLPLSLAIEILHRIVDAVELPVTIDLESGYGDAPEVVGNTIAMAIEAGAVGGNLEDSFPSDGRLREISDQIKRIRSAREAADVANVSFFLNARCDVFLQRPANEHDDEMVDEAIARAHAFADAGADGFFAPGVTDLSLISRIIESSPLPLNVMVEDATPALHTLAEHGVARVSCGPRPYIIAMMALEGAAREYTVTAPPTIGTPV